MNWSFVNYLAGAVELVVVAAHVAAVVVGGGGAALFLPVVRMRGGVEQPDEEEPCGKFGINDLINFVAVSIHSRRYSASSSAAFFSLLTR